jgi:hypothetical protein
MQLARYLIVQIVLLARYEMTRLLARRASTNGQASTRRASPSDCRRISLPARGVAVVCCDSGSWPSS